MIDINVIRECKDKVQKVIAGKRAPVDLDLLLSLDDKRRTLQQKLDGLKHEQKTLSKEIGSLKAKKEDASRSIKAVTAKP